jgi:peptide/nickel transport system substrate-binding protein
VQTFRIKSTHGPFRNAKYRQAFNFLMDRRAILRVGYAGLGEVTALPWAPASPAADRSYDTRFAYDLDKARALLRESGLSQAEMNDWKLLVNGSDQDAITISQIVQSSLQRVGISIQLDIKQGAEWQEALVGGKFDATFGGIGNAQKFPTRVANNSIYRTSNNPVLGEPHPHPDYVAAIERVNKTFGSGADIKAAYDNLNRAMIEAAFAIPTNTFDVALIVAGKNLAGFTSEIDNMLVGRTIGFR